MSLSKIARPADFVKNVYILYEDAPVVLGHAEKQFASLTTLTKPEYGCPIHSCLIPYNVRPVMEHERLRILWSWYFLKLYTRSYSSDHVREQRRVLDAALTHMSVMQNSVLFSVVCFLCEDLDAETQEVSIDIFVRVSLKRSSLTKTFTLIQLSNGANSLKINQELKIADPDPPEELIHIQANFQLPDGAETRRNVTDEFVRKKEDKWDQLQKRKFRPCDICQIKWRGGPCCSPRDPQKGLWDL